MPHPTSPTAYFVQGMDMNVGEWVSLPVTDQYMLEAEAFGRVIRKEEKLVWGVDDAIQNMKIIDAFFKAGKSRQVGKALISGPPPEGN